MQTAPSPVPSRIIRCYHCGHGFSIPARAVSTSCPKCSRQLSLEDVVIKSAHFVRKLQTCGKILVEPKGILNAAHIDAQQGIEVQGQLEGNVFSGGPVRITAKAQWKGDCRAPTLRVENGARIAKGYFVIPDETYMVPAELPHEAAPPPEPPPDPAGPPKPPPMKTSSTRRPRPPAPGP